MFGQLLRLFCSWRTNLTGLPKGHVRAGHISASFIDEYRLFGTVRPDRETMLMLWDSSKVHTSRDPPGMVFQLGPNYVDDDMGPAIRNHEMNHILPFRESPSMGVVGLVVYKKPMIRSVLIIPVRTLASFVPGTRATYVPWQNWLHFATPIELTSVSSLPHILHSQVLSVHGAGGTLGSTSILRVLDFSLRSRRRQVQDDPSAPLPPYTVRESPFDAEYRNSTFDFTEGGVLATSVRIYVIAMHDNVLT